MIKYYEDLLVATGADGAFAPVGVASHEAVELDEVLAAWYQERHNSIEAGMFLERARKLLLQILFDEDLTPQTRRKIRSLVRAMKDTRR